MVVVVGSVVCGCGSGCVSDYGLWMDGPVREPGTVCKRFAVGSVPDTQLPSNEPLYPQDSLVGSLLACPLSGKGRAKLSILTKTN